MGSVLGVTKLPELPKNKRKGESIGENSTNLWSVCMYFGVTAQVANN